MARRRYHKRNSSGNQLKALPIEAMYAAGVSGGTLLIYAGVILSSVYLSGETPRWIGGLGTLGIIAAVAALIYNIGQMKTKTELKYRLICLGVSSVVAIVWLATLIIGFIRG